MENFTKAMQFISKWEWMDKEDGAYTDHPQDPGGETKWGISKKGHPDLDIKNLKKNDAYFIYYTQYWLPMECDSHEFPMACVLFDTAVNMGVGKAKTFQEASTTLQEYFELRTRRYLELASRNSKLKVFRNGWLRRVNDLKKFVG
jgi:lysozyme family protein